MGKKENKLITKEMSGKKYLAVPYCLFDDEILRQLHAEEKECSLLAYNYVSETLEIDLIKWPDYNAEHLRSALYDAREQGYLPLDCSYVALPDDTIFDID